MQLTRRRYFAALAAGTIILGLFVVRARPALPAALGDMLGDALWAAMMVWLVSTVAPARPQLHRATLAVAICWAVEYSQRYHVPWIDAWRGTLLGRLVLGSDFDPRDLVAYAVGVVAACLIERAGRNDTAKVESQS